MSRINLTKDYVGGVVAGSGMGLVFCPLLINRFAVDPTHLAYAGAAITLCGAFFVLFTQTLAAAKDPEARS